MRIMHSMDKKAFAYLRVSGKGQVDGDGFPRQLSAIDKYAEANGLKVRKVFREEGISGTKELENRPALQELLAAIDSAEVKVVIIEKLDRLARDLMVQETISVIFANAASNWSLSQNRTFAAMIPVASWCGRYSAQSASMRRR